MLVVLVHGMTGMAVLNSALPGGVADTDGSSGEHHQIFFSTLINDAVHHGVYNYFFLSLFPSAFLECTIRAACPLSVSDILRDASSDDSGFILHRSIRSPGGGHPVLHCHHANYKHSHS